MEKGLLVEEVVQEFNSVVLSASQKHMPFTEMSCEQLIGYILVHHHFYVKQIMPTIAGHLEKVAGKHGDRFPYMQEVYNKFREVQEDMSNHMQKEEVILFPRIKKMEELSLSGNESALSLVEISGPITVMMNEHDQAGDLLYAIRALTNHYTVPEGACTTFKVCLSELKEFEEDLHRHVHLENNHLFPKALGLAVAE